jgi:hypothetical protein
MLPIIDANKEIYIAQWCNSKWLVASSFFFMIPAGYACMNQLYFYTALLGFTSLVSANYWRRATYSWRRNLDLVASKISFVVFVSKGVLYVRTPHYCGYTGLVLLFYCYYLSGKLFALKNDDWYKYHIAFHFFIMCEQIIVIDSILKCSHVE